LCP
jgi:toxin YhaV